MGKKMASNSFGSIFRITTWGESHGKAIGVVIDGCPAGLELNEEYINIDLKIDRDMLCNATRKEKYDTPSTKFEYI